MNKAKQLTSLLAEVATNENASQQQMKSVIKGLRPKWSRKENSLENVKGELDISPELKAAIAELPVIKVSSSNLLKGEWPDHREGGVQFYIIDWNGKKFLVDNQGYDYPRYVVQLKGAL